MKIRDFTQPEIDKLIALCNFSDEELTYFLMRAKDRSNVSEAKVSKLARRVKDKILKVL